MNCKDPFDKRVSQETAQKQFEEYCDNLSIKYYKYGIDNHPFGSKLYKANRIVRNTPDYFILKGDPCFVEVKSCGEILRMKLLDFDSYDFWNKLMKVFYCIYSSELVAKLTVSHKKLKHLISVNNYEIEQYPDAHKYDKKEYYPIPVKDLL